MKKYEKPAAETVEFKALEENALLGEQGIPAGSTSIIGTNEGVDNRDQFNN